MLLSLSSFFFACIVYQYCFNDDLSFFNHFSSAEPSETYSQISRPIWDQFSSAVPELMPYGTWKSPIQSSLIVENVVTPTEIQLDEKGNVFWIELRPSEAGRYVLRSNRSEKDLIAKTFNCRTRVHEYGGGSYIVQDDTIFFTNFLDQRIYRLNLNGENDAKPFSPESTGASLRFADFRLDSVHQQLIGVHENHLNESDVRNSIVALSLADGSSIVTLAEGFDFYSSPRTSPDGKFLIWLCWNHPNMPWDQTELWIGEISSTNSSISLLNQRKLFGNLNESILQPRWSSDGKFIYFVSDRNNWWNIYRSSIDGQMLEHVYDMEAEFGGPAWQFGSSYYDFDSNGNLVACFWKDGTAKLARIEVEAKKLTAIEVTNVYTDIRSVYVRDENVYFIGSSAVKPAEIVHLNLKTNSTEILFRSTQIQIDSRYLSTPEMITYKSGNAYAHGIYYPPKNDDYEIPKTSDELPPLLVRTHGGPTSATTSAFNLRIQYWTSRGFALLDVNYRGSTGYGRKYRDSLKDNWGLYDVEDCVSGAEHLVEQNKIDRKRVTIDGGSAGGYTTLCALTMTNYFSAGASHYGVSDLETLARDTHKFESRYLDSLIGEYPAKKDVYQQRSPIHHIENLSKPIIFFQGTEDKIVLPSQAESMVNALRAKKLPVAYVLFEGEQHGFRQAENIRKSLDGQFYFFSRIFHFQMADEVEPIPIENFDEIVS